MTRPVRAPRPLNILLSAYAQPPVRGSGPEKPRRLIEGRVLAGHHVTVLRSGVAYVGVIVGAYSRMIAGWRVAAHIRADMVLDALSMASWQQGQRSPDGFSGTVSWRPSGRFCV